MNILIIGSGAREHALAWKIRQSPRVDKVYIAPGNAGTAQFGQNLPIPMSDLPGLAEAAQRYHIDLTVVGPEAPLAAGIVDLFQSRGLNIFGPTQAAAEIESSKVFAKALMQKYGIPCAASVTFSRFSEAREYVLAQKPPVVIKADGLAAGKGVTVAFSTEEALQALANTMEARAFGPAGARVLVEEYLTGREASLLALTDGETVLPLAPARDYKRAEDGDGGPNTGGMGGYSPPEFFPAELVRQVQKTILEPTVKALAKEGRPYRGVLYAGLILTDKGLKVLEFNARFGDPETQVMLPRLRSDFLEALLAVTRGTLKKVKLEWSPEPCVGVVLASGGYPGKYAIGFPITGWEALDREVTVFHAGTKRDASGQVVTDGGRVLTVVASGATWAEARQRVYQNLPRLRFENYFYRRDIAAGL